jgi:hypothetical protein
VDESLRDLERRAATDPAARQELRRALQRAGVDVASTLAHVREAERSLGEARAAYARAMALAFRRVVSSVFGTQPLLTALDIAWALDERRDGPWTVRFQVAGEPAWALDDEARRALLRVVQVLASNREPFGARRIERQGEALRFAETDGPQRWSQVEAHATVPLRLLEDVGPHRPALEPLRVQREGDLAAQLALVGAADEALILAELAFLERAGAAWERFVPALFAERDLDLLAIQGFTPGYNDNWYDEHRQTVWIETGVEWFGLADLVEGCRRHGIAEDDLVPLELVPPFRTHDADEAKHAARDLEPWVTYLRMCHGHQFIITLTPRHGPRVGRGFRDI